MKAALALLARRWALITMGLALLVAGLSLIPKAHMSETAQSHDKLQHLAAYAAIALPPALARPGGWGWSLVAVAGLSAGIEFVQPLVNRASSLTDFAANAAGIALGVALAAGLRRLR